jgi:hypothetical protein
MDRNLQPSDSGKLFRYLPHGEIGQLEEFPLQDAGGLNDEEAEVTGILWFPADPLVRDEQGPTEWVYVTGADVEPVEEGNG